MRLLCLAVAFLLSMPLAAQPTPEKPAAKKKAPAKKQQVVHKKPTPEQIRKFNELQKKR